MKKTIVVAPVSPEPSPEKKPFWRGVLTDHNGDFDMGAVLVGFVAIFMCVAQWYATSVNGDTFNPQEFGIGIAAMLGGFAAYKWGDAKRPDTTTTTVTTK